MYGVWLTTMGVSSTDDITRWLGSRRWSRITLFARGTHPSGQMVKEMHAVWVGADGTVLPSSDAHLQYGPLYISESRTSDPGDVPSRAPGEKPPPSPEVEQTMRDAVAAQRPPAKKASWLFPVVLAGGALALSLAHPSEDPPPDEDENDD